MNTQPIPTMVKRWKCPHCNWHFPTWRKAAEHIARCWLDPTK